MRKINDQQKQLYQQYELTGSENHMRRYTECLKKFSGKKTIHILDIGGASGSFAFLLKEFFKQSDIDVFVVDTTEYETWKENKPDSRIHFICDSVENLDSLFPEKSFDIIFANLVFHHFVDKSWHKTLCGMEQYMKTIRTLLKDEGMFCIMDHFYNGLLIDSATSFLIYTFSSIKNPLLARIIEKMGAKSAGVGVCFQSKNMWLSRLKKCGFTVIGIDKTDYYKLTGFKRIGLLSKEVCLDNIIYAIPNATSR